MDYTPPDGYEKGVEGRRLVDGDWYEYTVYRKFVDRVGGHAAQTDVPQYHIVVSNGQEITTETFLWPPSKIKNFINLLRGRETGLDRIYIRLARSLKN